MYLIDTCVISEFVARTPNKDVVQWIESLDPDDVYLSVITIGEIQKGVEKLAECRRKEDLRAWLNNDLLARFSGRILEIDVPVMLVWGEMVGRFERSAKTVPAMDSLIAALAMANSFKLVTRNVKDFRFTGVDLVNPWDLNSKEI